MHSQRAFAEERRPAWWRRRMPSAYAALADQIGSGLVDQRDQLLLEVARAVLKARAPTRARACAHETVSA
eukprot:9037839-Alexandrium_andersonii.AAC.1